MQLGSIRMYMYWIEITFCLCWWIGAVETNRIGLNSWYSTVQTGNGYWCSLLIDINKWKKYYKIYLKILFHITCGLGLNYVYITTSV